MANHSKQPSGSGSDDWGAPVTPPGPGGDESPTGENQGFVDWIADYVPYWLTWRETMIGAALGAVGVVVLMFVIAVVLTLFDSSSLSSTLAGLRAERASDTFEGWTGAYDAAEATLADRSGTLRQAFHTLGFFVPTSGPYYLRNKVEKHRAFVAAVLEYRFEAQGSRRARERTWAAFDKESDDPLFAATQVFLHLNRGEPGAALATARDARKNHKNHRLLHAAHLEAALAAGRAEPIRKVAESLRKARTSPNGWEQFLLARAARFSGESSARKLLETMAEQRSNHLGGQLAQLEALKSSGEAEKVKQRATQLLSKHAESGAPHQLSRLHGLAAWAYEQTGSTEKATAQYDKAIDANPNRPEAYRPKVEILIDRGLLNGARRTLDEAFRKGEPTSEMLALRAELDYLQGRFDEALELLTEPPDSVALAPAVQGRILLARGEPQRAADELGTVDSSHPRHATARALEIAAQTAASSEVPDSAASDMKSLVSAASNRPTLLRAAARLHLTLAERSGGDERDSHLERARKLLEDAGKQSDSALTDYLLCEVHKDAGDEEKAATACDRARSRNPDFVPGMLTVARLRLQQQRPDDAAALLAGLVAQFNHRWDVASLYVRTLLRSHQVGRAADVLDAWKDRAGADETERRLLRGRLRYTRGDYKGAIELLKKVREEDRFENEASIFYAHSLLRLGRLEAAEKLVDPLTDVEKWDGFAWAIFGELRREQEEELDAIENTRIARRNLDMETAPKYQISYAYAESALAWRAHRDWGDDRVQRYLNRGLERGDLRSPELGFARGLFYLYGPAPDSKRATRIFERVVEVQSHRCEAIGFLDNAYEESNDYDGMERVDGLLKEYCQ